MSKGTRFKMSAERLEELKQELLSFMNQKDAASGKTLDYEAEIADLQRQYDEISASLPSSNEKIYASCAGYFISGTDGYEEVVDFSQALNLTPSDIKNLDSKKNLKSENAVGRISKEHSWYIAFNVSGNDIEVNDGNTWMSICPKDAKVQIK